MQSSGGRGRGGSGGGRGRRAAQSSNSTNSFGMTKDDLADVGGPLKSNADYVKKQAQRFSSFVVAFPLDTDETARAGALEDDPVPPVVIATDAEVAQPLSVDDDDDNSMESKAASVAPPIASAVPFVPPAPLNISQQSAVLPDQGSFIASQQRQSGNLLMHNHNHHHHHHHHHDVPGSGTRKRMRNTNALVPLDYRPTPGGNIGGSAVVGGSSNPRLLLPRGQIRDQRPNSFFQPAAPAPPSASSSSVDSSSTPTTVLQPSLSAQQSAPQQQKRREIRTVSAVVANSMNNTERWCSRLSSYTFNGQVFRLAPGTLLKHRRTLRTCRITDRWYLRDDKTGLLFAAPSPWSVYVLYDEKCTSSANRHDDGWSAIVAVFPAQSTADIGGSSSGGVIELPVRNTFYEPTVTSRRTSSNNAAASHTHTATSANASVSEESTHSTAAANIGIDSLLAHSSVACNALSPTSLSLAMQFGGIETIRRTEAARVAFCSALQQKHAQKTQSVQQLHAEMAQIANDIALLQQINH